MTTMSELQYQLLPADRAADDLERELLERWQREDLFQQTLDKNAGGKPWVFFEGPPTANGKPGIHHVFARTIKDLFYRHRAMRGYRVSRKAGWDTHGLPVEIEVEKQLGISGKQQIEAIGVTEFNRLCRESVFKYRADWEKLSARIGYWLDYEHPYVTYTNDYVESVWWALKTLHDKSLLYRGHKILPYCSRCETALSSHELALGYKDVEGPSVYVALDVVEDGGRGSEGAGNAEPGRRFLVWTTTPWTLVSNVALAVHPDIDYVEVRRKTGTDARTLILAEARLKGVLGDDFDDRWSVVAKVKGSVLVGMRYKRPLDWLDYPEGKHEVVVPEDFVSASDGSGIVHMAPAFGADDYAAGRRHNLAMLQPVNSRGRFPADLPLVPDTFVLDADPALTEELGRRGVLFKAAKHMHSYPHCWRCGTPLIYYARTSWFIKTSSYKDSMLARNARIDWHPPEVGEGRFGEWLKNNIDWAISRDRFWGTPLPVWVCDVDDTHVDVIGSYADLATRTGASLPADFDPHKPQVDSHQWSCRHTECGGTMRRTPEVIDTWFDSGSMSFAQWHYPFENADVFADQFPADFIAEGVDQTRGWFYSLLAIATGLGDALTPDPGDGHPAPPPYKAVVVNDLLLDKDGQKMSKSKGNVVDPHLMIERYGVDALRIFFVASSDVSVSRRFDEKIIREQAGRFLLTLKNVYSGSFAQYANFGWRPSASDPAPLDRPPIDRWLLARLAGVEQTVDDALDRFDATSAARAIIAFVDEDLSKWYVRLTRDRRYDIDTDDARAAFATLHEALVSVCRLLAPFAPFVTDWMHRELTGESVHLAPFVAVRGAGDPGLERAMEAIRELARLGRAAREVAGIGVRQPLARLVCVAPVVSMSDFESLIPLLREELNVKQVELATTADALVTLEAKPNFRALGKRFGKKTPLAAAAVAAFSSPDLLAFERGEPLVVSVEGESHELLPEEVTILRRSSGDLIVQDGGGYFAAIDPEITPALRAEGLAREVISRVQRMRKESGFAISDRITLMIAGEPAILEAVDTHQDWIKGEVLATELVAVDGGKQEYSDMTPLDLDGITARVSITRNR
ncbi:MAG: isoleucine--tRNA ligase [Gemmatimonadaceae bacterium]